MISVRAQSKSPMLAKSAAIDQLLTSDSIPLFSTRLPKIEVAEQRNPLKTELSSEKATKEHSSALQKAVLFYQSFFNKLVLCPTDKSFSLIGDLKTNLLNLATYTSNFLSGRKNQDSLASILKDSLVVSVKLAATFYGARFLVSNPKAGLAIINLLFVSETSFGVCKGLFASSEQAKRRSEVLIAGAGASLTILFTCFCLMVHFNAPLVSGALGAFYLFGRLMPQRNRPNPSDKKVLE